MAPPCGEVWELHLHPLPGRGLHLLSFERVKTQARMKGLFGGIGDH